MSNNSTINSEGGFCTYGFPTEEGLAVEIDGTRYLVHNLVAECFLNDGKPIPKGYVVRHINGNIYDNRADNLEIVKERKHRS